MKKSRPEDVRVRRAHALRTSIATLSELLAELEQDVPTDDEGLGPEPGILAPRVSKTPQQAPTDASLEARAEGALKAWRNNGSISDVADLRSWLAVVRAVDASRPDDPDMAHLRAELQGAIAEATAYAKTIGLRDAEIARLENESRSGLSEEEAQRWGEMVAAKLDKDVDYEAILAVEAMRLTRGDALPEMCTECDKPILTGELYSGRTGSATHQRCMAPNLPASAFDFRIAGDPNNREP